MARQTSRRLPYPSPTSLMLPLFPPLPIAYGSGFVFSAYRHKVRSRPIAPSSPSWELLTSWPFGSHASYRWLQCMAKCRLFIFTSIPQGKWISCSLSHAQTTSTHNKLIALNQTDFTLQSMAKNIASLSHSTTSLLMCPLSDLYNLFPFRRNLLRPYLGKTLASTGSVFSEFLNYSYKSFSAYCQILIIYICPQTSLKRTTTYTSRLVIIDVFLLTQDTLPHTIVLLYVMLTLSLIA